MHSDHGVTVWGLEKWKGKEAHIKEKSRKMTVVINKSEHEEEDGIAWKVKTLTDKEVKKKTKRDNSKAEILLNGEGKKKKHSILGIGDGRTSPANMVNMGEQKLVSCYRNLSHTVLS